MPARERRTPKQPSTGSARLPAGKHPQTGPARPESGKHPQIARDALPGAENSDDRLCWRFEFVDHEGPWGWSKVTPEKLVYILGKLRDFEQMTVSEVFHGGSPGKDYPVEELPSVAAKRLVAVKFDDQTQISRIQLSGKERLYGLRRGNVFHILWWDPEHTVWPSPRR